MFERLRPIPFNNRVAIPDPDLERKLMAEASGILNWMIEGAWRILTEPGFYRRPPSMVMAGVEEYRDSMDIIGSFVADCCEPIRPETVIAAESLFAAFRVWAKDSNQFDRMSKRRFTGLLKEAGYEMARPGSARKGNRLRGIKGLKLTTDYTDRLLRFERHMVRYSNSSQEVEV